MKQNTVGRVITKQFTIEEDLKLSSGKTLSNVELAYETYGELNSAKSTLATRMKSQDGGRWLLVLERHWIQINTL